MDPSKIDWMRPTAKALILPIAIQLVAWFALAPFTVHSPGRVSELLGVAFVIGSLAVFSWEICAAPVAATFYIRDSNGRTASNGFAVAISLIYVSVIGAHFHSWFGRPMSVFAGFSAFP